MILFKRRQNNQRQYDYVIYDGNIPNPNYNKHTILRTGNFRLGVVKGL